MPLPSTSNVSRPQALGYGALLDDLYLRLVGNPELQSNPQIETLRPEATRIDTGQNPEDFISEVGQTFSRAQFAGGEGLGFAHREGSAKNRYWDSRNVDVQPPDPGDRHATSLLNATANINSSVTDLVHIDTDGSSLWFSDGSDLLRSDDPLSDTPTWTTESTGLFNGGRFTVLNDEVFSGGSVNGEADVAIAKRATDGTWTTKWSNLGSFTVWSAKRRVIAQGSSHPDAPNTSPSELYEARSGSDSVLIATLQPGQEWTDVADGGSHILAAADDGYVYAFTADDNADMALEAQSHFPFEEPQRLTVVGGQVFVATQRNTDDGILGRIWRGVLAGDGTLQELSLLREFGGPNYFGRAIKSAESDGRFAYFGVTTARVDGDSDVGIWRYDASTGGLSRHFVNTSSSSAHQLAGITFIGERLFFLHHNDGVFRQEDTYETDGYLTTPAADFFTALDKSWQEITVDAELPTGDDGTDTTVEAYYATDLDAMDDPNSSLWTLAGTVTPSSTDDTFQVTGVESRFLVLMVKLYSSTDQTATPEVNSISVTATVVAEEVSVSLPVNVSDVIELPGRKRHNLYGLGEKVYQELRGKHGKEATLELFRPAEKIRGVVWSVSAPVPSVSSRGERTVVCNVEVRGKPTS